MATAQTKTWIPLDTAASILGYSLYEFNGISKFPCQVERNCGNIWFQFPEQSDYVSREEFARALKESETIISNWVGYNLMPDWTMYEIVKPPRYFRPEYDYPYNVRNQRKSVKMKKRHIQNLGIKVKTFVEELSITRVDNDGDGFFEKCRITLSTVPTDSNNIHIYYPSQNGSDDMEIRPFEFISNTIIEFPVWSIVKKSYIDINCVDGLDGTNNDIYETEVDVYTVKNDKTIDPVTLIYENDCVTDCSDIEVLSCGRIRDNDEGYVVYDPNSICSTIGKIEPDKIRVNYYSGWLNYEMDTPYTQLDPKWHLPIVSLAVSLIDRPFSTCCGGNESARITSWQKDFAESNEKVSYAISSWLIENPFGVTTKGAWYSYSRVRQYKDD